MKQWFNKFQLLSWKELLLIIRTRKGILLVIVIIGLGIISQVLHHLGATVSSTCSDILFSGYLNFLQFLPFALAILLADVVSGERERKTWNFFFSKPFTSGQVLLSKFFVNYLFVGIAIIGMWTGVYLFAHITTAGCHLMQAIYPLIVLLATSFAIVSLEITISTFFRRVSISVLVIVLAWIGLMIANMAIPVVKGFIAPWATNSYQTSVVSRILDIHFYPVPFEDSVVSPSMAEKWQAVLLPLVQGILLYIVAWVTIRRSTKV